jgi:hypothetical protein
MPCRRLLIPFKLPLALFLAISEHALLIPVQRPHHADTRQHRRAATRDDHQGLHCCLPFRRAALGLGQFGDVVAGVLQRDELAAVRQGDWIELA